MVMWSGLLVLNILLAFVSERMMYLFLAVVCLVVVMLAAARLERITDDR
jgi:hypothetical protein